MWCLAGRRAPSRSSAWQLAARGTLLGRAGPPRGAAILRRHLDSHRCVLRLVIFPLFGEVRGWRRASSVGRERRERGGRLGRPASAPCPTPGTRWGGSCVGAGRAPILPESRRICAFWPDRHVHRAVVVGHEEFRCRALRESAAQCVDSCSLQGRLMGELFRGGAAGPKTQFYVISRVNSRIS